MPTGQYLSARAVASATRRHDRGLGRTVQRLDRIEWRLDASRKIVHESGVVDAPGVATRTGVLVYEDPDEQGRPQVTRELRPASEVFDPASLATLVGAPVTIEHPGQGPDDDQGAGEVTPQTMRALTHGWVLRVEPDPATGVVWVWVRLYSEDVLQACQAGKTELSCGYTALLVDPRDPEAAELVATLGPEPGVAANGDRYDLVQTQIRYNHLAVVDQARAGPVARLHLDARTMKTKITIAGKTHEIQPFMVKAIRADALDVAAQAKAKADALEVGEITIEGQQLVLPKSLIDQILAMLGGGTGPSAAEPPPMDAQDPMKDPLDPGMMGDKRDEKDPDDKKDQAMKGDAMDSRIEAMIDRALAKKLPAAQARIVDSVTSTSRARAELERSAMPVLGIRFDYQAHDEHGLAVSVLEAAASPRLERGRALAEQARKGDAIAAGRLRQMMDDALEQRRDEQDSTGGLTLAMFQVADPTARTDAQDERPSWETASQTLRDSATGRKPTRPAA